MSPSTGGARVVNDALSVIAAARDAPAAPALRLGGHVFAYAELADRVRERIAELRPEVRPGVPVPLVADNTLATVVTLQALLELGAPALLVHPRLTPAERSELLDAAGRSAPIAHPGAAVVIHTSGTTGTPRAAVLTRSALLASAAASAANLGWAPDDCWHACMPLARVGGLSILTRCLAARRCVDLAPGFDVAAFPDTIARHRITLASVVPTMLRRLLDAHPGWRPPAHLRAVLVGGEAAPEALLREAAARGLPILTTYGMTETCSQVVATPYAARMTPWAYGAGVALPGAEVRVVAGRIEVRGPMRMAGYWNEPPLGPEEWFDTGDLGSLDAHGGLHVRARRDDLIVTGGENVYPAEVERVLEGCPGIAEAAVFGLPDATWGQTVAAALVVVPGCVLRDDELQAWLRARLAPHKRPRRICRVERLPRTAAGKLDRGALVAYAPLLDAPGEPR